MVARKGFSRGVFERQQDPGSPGAALSLSLWRRVMWRKAFVGLLASLAANSTIGAQAGTITGSVTTADGGRPISRVQVVVVGTGQGGITGDDGGYTILLYPGTYTLRVRRLGFGPDSANTVIVASGGSTTRDFRLTPSAQVLGDVVAIGYGTTRARDLTGSVSTTTERDFNPGRVVSPEELIRAKVPGVQVVDNN